MAETIKIPKQTNTIIHPRYACSVGAVASVTAIRRAIPIVNCGPGCVGKQFGALSSGNGYQGEAYLGDGSIPSVNIGEKETVFGAGKKLDDLIKSTLKIMDGDLFVVLTGCSSELVGDDVGSVVKPYADKGHPIVFSQIAGFKGNNLYGHEQVMIDIIDQYVDKFAPDKDTRKKGLINLWFETPYFNTNWRGDFIEFKRILEGAGFKVNLFFGAESGGVAELKSIPNAQFNLVVSPWVGVKIAEHLKKKYDQPYLHIPVVPIGEEATTEFLRKVVAFAGIGKKKSEAFIAKEAEIYYYFLEHFSTFFSDFWYGLPARFATVGDTLYNSAVTKFLADQIGLIPVRQIITDNPPEKYREGIREIYRNLSEDISVEIEFLEDGYVIEKTVEATDFGKNSVPLILGTSWESDVAAKLKALLIRISPPVTEEVITTRSFVGYRGALALIEKIFSATVGAK